jgi:hypothetical protein
MSKKGSVLARKQAVTIVLFTKNTEPAHGNNTIWTNYKSTDNIDYVFPASSKEAEYQDIFDNNNHPDLPMRTVK